MAMLGYHEQTFRSGGRDVNGRSGPDAVNGNQDPLTRPWLETISPEKQGPAVAVAQTLQDRADALVRRSVDAMYANPFWEDRFGERGRRYAEQDGHYHISYLVHALWFGTPAIMTTYARWLQGVLIPRGMCTRHLAENYAKLRDAVRAERISDPEEALAYLQSAEDCLRYETGPARAVLDAAPQLAGNISSTVCTSRSDWYGGSLQAATAQCTEDVLYLLSYLADAVALEDASTFVGYVTWLAGFLGRRGVATATLVRALEALDDALANLSADAHAATHPMVASALGALRAGTE
jgi:hypothetical protein